MARRCPWLSSKASRWWSIFGPPGAPPVLPSAVKRFLSQYPVEYPIGLAGLNGTALMTALGNLQGGLPFTLVIDAQQGLRLKKLGKLTEADIGSWA